MARISIDPTEVKKHPKFHAFRKKLDWSPHHAFGVLCAFWGEVANTEANESGDISDWTPDYLADRIGVSCDPASLWDALVPGYIEVRNNDRYFVRDWLEIAGDFLREKWRARKDGVQHLGEIWGNYRRLYGRSTEPKSGPPVDVQSVHSETTVGEINAKNREISVGETGPLRSSLSTPLPSSHPKEDLEAYIPSRGSDEKSLVGFVMPEPVEPEQKEPAAVRILQAAYVKKLTEMFKENPAGFNYGAAGRVFKKLLDQGWGVQEIENRVDAWFKSTDVFVLKRGYRIEDFPAYFNRLKDGPITNQVGTNGVNGARKFYDGLATAGAEKEFPE